jgi:hypothetical protein
MARFRTTLITDAPATSVLDRLGDFATIADWDPGVTNARRLSGEPGQEGTRYAVDFSFGPRHIPLEYEIVARAEPEGGQAGHVVLVAKSGSFSLHDTITVQGTPTGTEVTYDALLTLHGPRRLMDWPLDRMFQIIGRRSEAGLRAELVSVAQAQAGSVEWT